MEKRLIHFVVMLPTSDKSSVISQPGDRAFDFPTAFVTPKRSTILKLASFIFPRRSNQLDASPLKFFAKCIRIIGFISNQVLRFFAQLSERFINQRYLMWGGRGNRHSQRKTPAVRHHHELRALAPLGFTNRWAPFFADTKLPSIKHSIHLIWPFLSSSRIKVRQIFSQTPCSSHIFKRLQQVLGLGYFSGKSFHRAPVQRIHRMPSTTGRLFFQGRPLLFNFGSKGSIFSHCFSVKYTARLIGLLPPMNLLSATTYNGL